MDHFKKGLLNGVSIEKNIQSEDSESVNKKGHKEEGEEHGKMIALEPGDSGTISFTLPESKTGTWKIGCFETTAKTSHYKFGMKGVLTVNPK
jgi:uncharacterized cupredoxin-like copper-binding protein